jgi:ribosomal protein L15
VFSSCGAGGRGTAGANNRRKGRSMHLLFYAWFGQRRAIGA